MGSGGISWGLEVRWGSGVLSTDLVLVNEMMKVLYNRISDGFLFLQGHGSDALLT
jgi:hypothetical protein